MSYISSWSIQLWEHKTHELVLVSIVMLQKWEKDADDKEGEEEEEGENVMSKADQLFLSDPSPIIGYACHSLTDWLTDCCLVNLIDVTLACKNANSKLVGVVTVADVDAEDNVGNSLLQIWELTFVAPYQFWWW